MSGAEIAGQMVLGWLLADFLGGLLHYVEDRQILPGFLDRHIGAPNRLHHADPMAFTRQPSILHRNLTTIFANVPVSALLYLAVGFTPLWVAASAGGLVTYEVHRWAHAPRLAPEWVRALQEIGLFQSPKAHALHHRPPQDRAYCVLTDWLNPLLDRVGWWRALDRTVACLTAHRGPPRF